MHHLATMKTLWAIQPRRMGVNLTAGCVCQAHKVNQACIKYKPKILPWTSSNFKVTLCMIFGAKKCQSQGSDRAGVLTFVNFLFWHHLKVFFKVSKFLFFLVKVNPHLGQDKSFVSHQAQYVPCSFVSPANPEEFRNNLQASVYKTCFQQTTTTTTILALLNSPLRLLWGQTAQFTAIAAQWREWVFWEWIMPGKVVKSCFT